MLMKVEEQATLNLKIRVLPNLTGNCPDEDVGFLFFVCLGSPIPGSAELEGSGELSVQSFYVKSKVRSIYKTYRTQQSCTLSSEGHVILRGALGTSENASMTAPVLVNVNVGFKMFS